jgi:hypothetical protein
MDSLARLNTRQNPDARARYRAGLYTVRFEVSAAFTTRMNHMISQISVPHHHAEQAQNHRPQPIWRCAVCKERRPAGSPHDAQDIYRQPEKCDACGSRELRGPYLPVDVPYRLHEEAYGTLTTSGHDGPQTPATRAS